MSLTWSKIRLSVVWPWLKVRQLQTFKQYVMLKLMTCVSSLDFKSSTRGEILKPDVHMNDPQVDVNMGHPLHWVAKRGHLQVTKELFTNDQVYVNAGHPLC